MEAAVEVRGEERGGHGMDTFLREGSQGQDMGTGSGEGRHSSYA